MVDLLTFCEGKLEHPIGSRNGIPVGPFHAATPAPDGDRITLCGRPEVPLLLIELPETPFPPRNAELLELCQDCRLLGERQPPYAPTPSSGS